MTWNECLCVHATGHKEKLCSCNCHTYKRSEASVKGHVTRRKNQSAVSLLRWATKVPSE